MFVEVGCDDFNEIMRKKPGSLEDTYVKQWSSFGCYDDDNNIPHVLHILKSYHNLIVQYVSRILKNVHMNLFDRERLKKKLI